MRFIARNVSQSREFVPIIYTTQGGLSCDVGNGLFDA